MSQLSEVMRHLRLAAQDASGMADGQLLDEFLNAQDQSSLAALIRRHGPMVWGVCRRILRNHHDAEDAFQATFLVLVRKAPSIVPREMVGNWLYGVAHQTAIKARSIRAKRDARERQVAELPDAATLEPEPHFDLYDLLDEELNRLPDRYRSVIVLCDLQGKSRKGAARQLGCPEGTVAGWLARARAMLARRLTQRGVTLAGGIGTLVSSTASASVPRSVMSSAIVAASGFATGKSATEVVSPKVAALTEGVLKVMFMSKLKIVGAVLLVIAVVFAGFGVVDLHQRSQAGERSHTTENEKPSKAKAEAKHVAEDAPEFPIAPPPVQALAKVNGKILLVMTRDANRETAPPIQKEQNAKALASFRTSYHDLSKVTAFDTKGKQIETKHLTGLLKKNTAVLVSADGRAVDPFHLQLIKDDTIILVLGSQTQENESKPSVAKDGKDPFRVNVREVKIPFRVKQDQLANIKQVLLNVSADQGKTWTLAATEKPDAQAFTYVAPNDGTYWFYLQVVNKDGRTEPTVVGSGQIGLKVIVDTTMAR